MVRIPKRPIPTKIANSAQKSFDIIPSRSGEDNPTGEGMFLAM